MKLRYICIATKIFCEQRAVIKNNKPGTGFFLNKDSLAINPFTPIRNFEYNQTIADLSRVIAVESGLQAGGQMYLYRKLNEFIRKNPHSNLVEFVEWLAVQKEKNLDEKGYHSRLLNRLHAVMLEIGKIFSCYRGINDDSFVKENLVIEICASSSFIISLVAGIILIRMFRLKACNPELLEYKNFIVIEDVQAGLMRNEKSQMLSEMSTYYWICNEARYYNIHPVFLVQGVKLLPQTVREASSVIISKRLNDTTEARVLAQLMNFTSLEQKQAMMMLKKIDAIIINKEI